MASRFERFSEDEIWGINEAVVQTNTKKATNVSLSVFTGRKKIIFLLNLQQTWKNPRNVCKLQKNFLLSDVFDLQKSYFFSFLSNWFGKY